MFSTLSALGIDGVKTLEEQNMLTENEIHKLLEIQASHPFLSVYLNTDPSDGSADLHKRQLRSLLKDSKVPEDAFAIERYIDHEYDWSGQSVAIFSCAAEGFLQAYTLAVPVRSRARVSDRPHVKPLADILDAYGGYGVVLVDKQGARLFYFHLGQLVEQEGMMGEAVRRAKRGGSSSIHGRRGGIAGQTNYAEEVAERNMREVAEFASAFFADKNVRRVLIGGTEDNVALFKSMLSKAWQSLIVGTFNASMTASKEEILHKALQIGQRAESLREEKIVDAVVNGAMKKRGGVIGLEETLNALRDGRVQTLVFREGYRAPGYRCQGCGYLTAVQLETCPFCEKAFDSIEDAVEMAVHDVMKYNGEVEVLHDGQASQKLGEIGALLRY
jgi:peptide chain release factor subunit 1